MKVVFLDLDGVLNSISWYDRRPPRAMYPSHLAYSIDPACLARLNRLCVTTGARIVFSSAWRHQFLLRDLNAVFAQLGCTARFIGRTPDLWQQPRGNEIQAWLAAHRPVDAFVILDDDRDMGELLPHLVRTDHHVGLTEADTERAIAILKANNNS